VASLGQYHLDALGDDGRFDDLARALDSARKAGDRRDPGFPLRRSAGFTTGSGRLREAREFDIRARALDSAAGRSTPLPFMIAGWIGRARDAGLPVPDADVKAFEKAVEQYDIESRPMNDRPYLGAAELYARIGRVADARQYLTRYDAAVARDTALKRSDLANRQFSEGVVLAAEKKWNEAAALFRKSDSLPDGPNGNCSACLWRDLAALYVEAGWADSAIAAYEAYAKTPYGARPRQGPDRFIGAPLALGLAKAYDSKGDAANAARLYADFIERWKNAEPELQPKVAEAKARLAKLGAVESVKR
jgi:hypothetical protein